MSNRQNGEDGVVEEHVVGGLAGVSGSAPGKDYREKTASTVVRVLTVFAYLFSVSFAAILLSVYYICVWKSPDRIDAQGQSSARRADELDLRPAFTGDSLAFNFTGRSNTSVNDYIAQPTIDNITSYLNTNETLSSDDWAADSTAMAADSVAPDEPEAQQNISSVT